MVGNGDKSYEDRSGPTEVPRSPERDYQEFDDISDGFPDQYGEAQVLNVDPENYNPDELKSKLDSSDQFNQENAPNTARLFRSDDLVVYVGEETVRYAVAKDSDVDADEALDQYSGLFVESDDPLEPEDEGSKGNDNGKEPRVSKFGGGSPFDRDHL